MECIPIVSQFKYPRRMIQTVMIALKNNFGVDLVFDWVRSKRFHVLQLADHLSDFFDEDINDIGFEILPSMSG